MFGVQCLIPQVTTIDHTVTGKRVYATIKFPLCQFHSSRFVYLCWGHFLHAQLEDQINFQVHTWAASRINIHHLRRDVTLDILYKLVHNPWLLCGTTPPTLNINTTTPDNGFKLVQHRYLLLTDALLSLPF